MQGRLLKSALFFIGVVCSIVEEPPQHPLSLSPPRHGYENVYPHRRKDKDTYPLTQHPPSPFYSPHGTGMKMYTRTVERAKKLIPPSPSHLSPLTPLPFTPPRHGYENVYPHRRKGKEPTSHATSTLSLSRPSRPSPSPPPTARV